MHRLIIYYSLSFLIRGLHFRYDRARSRDRRRVTDPRANSQDNTLAPKPNRARGRGDTRHHHRYRCRLRSKRRSRPS